jgi:hypothetical protein
MMHLQNLLSLDEVVCHEQANGYDKNNFQGLILERGSTLFAVPRKSRTDKQPWSSEV